MIVRPAREEDREAIGIIFCRGWQDAYKGIIDQEYLDTLTPQAAQPKNINPEITYVCQTGEEVIGVVNFGIARQENDPELGEIRAIYVLPERQGQGAGSLMFKKAQNLLQDRGYKGFILWSLLGNQLSHDFYIKMGMSKTDRIKNYKIANKDYPSCQFEYHFDKE
ncbi:MAG: GNAT family N-acetyltransferase [Firmicutes bacterium]|nr:GNAT family N-acetyltransferase [Bacillota bacterium]